MKNGWCGKEYILVVLLAVVVLAGWLGQRGLAEPDEGRYAEISREMVVQQDMLIPRLNGVPHLQKPPMTYWVTAAFIRLLGPHEWAVRLTPALAAFGTTLLAMYIAGVLYGPDCRWKTGLLLVVSGLFFSVARLITTDMLLTFFITGAIAGLLAYAHRGRKAGLACFYLAMGLGFLTKGPLALLIPGLTALALQVGSWRVGRPVVRLYWLAGLPVALLIGLSWYLLLIHRDRSLFDYFFRYELLDRVATDVHSRSKPMWFYPGMLVVGFLPWTAFALAMLADVWRRRGSLASGTPLLFAGWILIPYLVLTLVVSKMATYLLPLMPPLAILVARWMEHPATGDRWRDPARLTTLLMAVALPGLPVLGLLPRIHLPAWADLTAGFWLAMAIVVASLVLLRRALGRGLALRPFLFWMAGTWAVILLALVSQADLLMTGGNHTVRTIAQHIQRLDPEGTAPVLVYRTRLNGLSFYLQRYVYRSIKRSDVILPLHGDLIERIYTDEQEIVRRFSSQPAFLVAREEPHLNPDAMPGWRILGRDGPWILMATHHLAERMPADAVLEIPGTTLRRP